jgi:hypothetical protein
MASLADAELNLVHGGKLCARECLSIVRVMRDESSWTVVQSKFHKGCSTPVSQLTLGLRVLTRRRCETTVNGQRQFSSPLLSVD